MTREHPENPSLEDMGEDFWNERYRSEKRIWSANPNRHLVAEAADLAPGRALDVGSGEGADALWLAERGWRVTAVDISAVALEKGGAHARERGGDVAGRITWTRADVTAWTPPEDAFDLVTSQFMHLGPGDRARLFPALASAVAPGGELLVVAHHPRDLEEGVPRPPIPEMFYTGDEVVAALPEGEWTVLVDEARPGTSTMDGVAHTVHDLVVRARRHA
ncbi:MULTISPECIES: SAM-dependent methyltransferase [Nocardiopsis]|uniref:Methyltransferase type 12 n=1 Tax=Nocardiopsis sinuspersici TaxID=501010 RepID=A0A1V3C981_9ACTN|nr:MULTISPECIES: class I SAM-dependent methyltransferase [Nocardiopsis]NYH52371.1 SAM-dependent methyltransferase [Nocardiopsis sinuspersici]OOC57331.1 methyltransferase type 12 [Nocardiopsis sinuspersici]